MHEIQVRFWQLSDQIDVLYHGQECIYDFYPHQMRAKTHQTEGSIMQQWLGQADQYHRSSSYVVDAMNFHVLHGEVLLCQLLHDLMGKSYQVRALLGWTSLISFGDV